MKRQPTIKPEISFHRQRGVAVIMALLLTALAVTLISSLFWQQQVQIRSIENQRLQSQSQWIMLNAIDWASLILREDARHSSIDTLDEPWAVPLVELPLNSFAEYEVASDATLSGSISDAQARLNLTNLCENGKISPVEVSAFQRLLATLHLNPALAQTTADAMLSTQASMAAPGSLTQFISFTQVDDLLDVPGFTPKILNALKDFVIFLPQVTPVNVNTAPAEVLAARVDGLTLDSAYALVASRSTASFTSLADFTLRLQAYTPPSSLSISEVAVSSNYFLINGMARMKRAELQVQSLVRRDGTSTRQVWSRTY